MSRSDKEFWRLTTFLIIWIIVTVATLMEVVLLTNGFWARLTIAVCAWMSGMVTARLYLYARPYWFQRRDVKHASFAPPTDYPNPQ